MLGNSGMVGLNAACSSEQADCVSDGIAAAKAEIAKVASFIDATYGVLDDVTSDALAFATDAISQAQATLDSVSNDMLAKATADIAKAETIETALSTGANAAEQSAAGESAAMDKLNSAAASNATESQNQSTGIAQWPAGANLPGQTLPPSLPSSLPPDISLHGSAAGHAGTLPGVDSGGVTTPASSPPRPTPSVMGGRAAGTSNAACQCIELRLPSEVLEMCVSLKHLADAMLAAMPAETVSTDGGDRPNIGMAVLGQMFPWMRSLPSVGGGLAAIGCDFLRDNPIAATVRSSVDSILGE